MREAWQQDLGDAYASIEELAVGGFISPKDVYQLRGVCNTTLVRVPRYYAALFDTHQPDMCPIRAQALPSLREVDPHLPLWAQAYCQRAFQRPLPWIADAIGDVSCLAAPRLTHRYHNRAIVHATTACALYCRFCFRKSHLGSNEEGLYQGSLKPALQYVSEHPEIRELIFTGGDPLCVSDMGLTRILSDVAAMGHVQVVRFHSRMAATLPSRLTSRLVAALATFSGRVVFVSHFNHPRELTPLALQALDGLRRAGIVLYNQAVLLRGVNADSAVLCSLFTRLYEAGITPYYLHHPDWTPKTFHFRTSLTDGLALMDDLAGRMSGPAMPRYVLDMPGGGGKVEVGRMRLLEERREEALHGALYAVQLPNTRRSAHVALYADFSVIA